MLKWFVRVASQPGGNEKSKSIVMQFIKTYYGTVSLDTYLRWRPLFIFGVGRNTAFRAADAAGLLQHGVRCGRLVQGRWKGQRVGNLEDKFCEHFVNCFFFFRVMKWQRWNNGPSTFPLQYGRLRHGGQTRCALLGCHGSCGHGENANLQCPGVLPDKHVWLRSSS